MRIFIALLLLVTTSPCTAFVKTKIDLGNIILGDELYLDAETIFNHDFKENPNYFVYPISNKGSLEMYSVARNDFVQYPLNCIRHIAGTKRGMVIICEKKLIYHSYSENKITYELRLPQETSCGGSFMGDNKGVLYFLCRKNVEGRQSKVYTVRLYTRGKREGEMQFLGRPVLTERIGSRFKLVQKFRKLESTYGLFYSS